ncbi:MAG: hypothetical protein AAGA91_14140 [Pseudomonadota bacterium]
MKKTVIVGVLASALVVLVVWWVAAPRTLHLPDDIVTSLQPCAELRAFDAQAVGDLTLSQLEERGQLGAACGQAKLDYLRANEANADWYRLWQPPRAIERLFR